MLRIITDFDGPLMDVSERYYCVYLDCLQQTKLPAHQIKQLSKAEFWQLKRARVPEVKIGLISGLDQEQALKFAQRRRKIVHSLPYLIHDRVIFGVVETLEKLQKLDIDLVVMTMRREKELAAAFEKYNLARFFKSDRRYCLPNNYNKKTDTEDKLALMEKALSELPPAADIWMIGDTEADIVAAKTHGVKVIGVLSGIRDFERLEYYQPNFIVNNFSEAANLVIAKVSSLT
ncbi:MAG: HAD family hydrolase [Xenococcaceae cyanobacterium MO_188.B32]|nr:HAD family hydrolase [Xenococcaceae cyanobacterium MO_188.B32]